MSQTGHIAFKYCKMTDNDTLTSIGRKNGSRVCKKVKKYHDFLPHTFVVKKYLSSFSPALKSLATLKHLFKNKNIKHENSRKQDIVTDYEVIDCNNMKIVEIK